MSEFNPLYRVGSDYNVPCPSAFEWNESDVSASDAGRTESVKMNKKRLGKVVSIKLAWNGINTETLQHILRTFDPEYLSITYCDPKYGNANNHYRITREFYVGDRGAPMYNSKLGLWESVSFDIIARNKVGEVV